MGNVEETGPDASSSLAGGVPPANALQAVLAVAVDQATESIMVTAIDGAILYVNPAFERMTGYSAAEAVGQTPRILQSGKHDRAFYDRLWQGILAGETFRGDVINRRKDGSLYTEEHSVTPVRDAAGQIAWFIAIAVDSTDRRRAEREVHLLQAVTRATAEAEDLDQALTEVLREVSEATGWSYGEAWLPAPGGAGIEPGASWYGIGPLVEEFHERSKELNLPDGVGLPGRVWRTGRPVWHEDVSVLPPEQFPRCQLAARVGFKAGLGVPIVDRGEVLAVLAFFLEGAREEDGELVSVVTTVASQLGSLIRRKRGEQELRESRERLAVVLRSIGDAVITTESSGNVELLNPVAEALTGWTQADAAGQPLTDVFRIVNEFSREPCENPVTKVLETGRVVGLANHTVLLSRQGPEYILNDSAAPIRDDGGETTGVVLVFRDVTEEKRLEEELQKAAKLESLGVLAGGIAHDFNNSLASIVAHIGLVRMSFAEETETAQKLREAELACLRATSLTRQLLTFAKGGAPLLKPAPVADLVRQSATFACTGSNVTCEFAFAPGLWPARLDEGQIGQVIGNLVINAQQAMPAGGTIHIRAENVDLDEDNSPAGLPLAPGRYVRISVRDEGTGIPREIIERIFDPYFTTKQKGSGLGLAASYSVVRNHDGHIAVESVLGAGSSFHVYLPASEPQLAATQTPAAGSLRRTGRILLMDDEDSIRRVMGEMLRRFGYRPSLARDGAEAVALYREALEAGEPFDAVILDLTVPGGMGGKEAMEALRELDPAVRAIVSSGYSNDPVMAQEADYGFAGVIAKPYGPDELLQVLDEVMAGRGTPAANG